MEADARAIRRSRIVVVSQSNHNCNHGFSGTQITSETCTERKRQRNGRIELHQRRLRSVLASKSWRRDKYVTVFVRWKINSRTGADLRTYCKRRPRQRGGQEPGPYRYINPHSKIKRTNVKPALNTQHRLRCMVVSYQLQQVFTYYNKHQIQARLSYCSNSAVFQMSVCSRYRIFLASTSSFYTQRPWPQFCRDSARICTFSASTAASVYGHLPFLAACH